MQRKQSEILFTRPKWQGQDCYASRSPWVIILCSQTKKHSVRVSSVFAVRFALINENLDQAALSPLCLSPACHFLFGKCCHRKSIPQFTHPPRLGASVLCVYGVNLAKSFGRKRRREGRDRKFNDGVQEKTYHLRGEEGLFASGRFALGKGPMVIQIYICTTRGIINLLADVLVCKIHIETIIQSKIRMIIKINLEKCRHQDRISQYFRCSNWANMNHLTC